MRILRAVLEEIVAHASADAPLECCGLLLGREDLIDGSRRARNLKASPVAFLVDPAAHFAAIRDARQTGRAVLGAYHSHTGTPAIPSSRDLGEWHDPELLQVIVSLGDGAIRAFRLEGRRAVEIPLEPAEH